MICHRDKEERAEQNQRSGKCFMFAQYISHCGDYGAMNLSFSVSSANYSVNYSQTNFLSLQIGKLKLII